MKSSHANFKSWIKIIYSKDLGGQSLYVLTASNCTWHYLLLNWVFCVINCNRYNSQCSLRQYTFKLEFQTIRHRYLHLPIVPQVRMPFALEHFSLYIYRENWPISPNNTTPHAVKNWGPITTAKPHSLRPASYCTHLFPCLPLLRSVFDLLNPKTPGVPRSNNCQSSFLSAQNRMKFQFFSQAETSNHKQYPQSFTTLPILPISCSKTTKNCIRISRNPNLVHNEISAYICL